MLSAMEGQRRILRCGKDDGGKGKSKDNRRSFDSLRSLRMTAFVVCEGLRKEKQELKQIPLRGMTGRKAGAKTKTKARATADSLRE